MVELNEKDLCIEIRESLSWDGSVKSVLEDIHQELKDWYENNLDDIKNTGEAYDATPEEMEDCKKFLDFIDMESDLSKEFKVAILKNIMENWDTVSYSNDYEVSIFDEDIIREGIFQTIEEEFNFDGRMGY
jgi:hypothetical protein